MSNEKVFLQKKINKGMALLDKNNFSEATKIFEYLKKQKQTEIIALLFLGIIEIKKKNHPSAKNLFYNILNIEPNNEDANLNLALVFFDEKNYDKTLLYLNKVIEINNNGQLEKWYSVPGYKNRWGFHGRRAIDRVRVNYINKSISHHKKRGAANPVRYNL